MSRPRVNAIRDDLNQRFGAQLDEAAIRVVTSVEPEYINYAFDAIVERVGSVEKYFSEVLHVTSTVRELIAGRLVA